MSLTRHEAGHAVVANALGWKVERITINAHDGTTYLRAPRALTPWRRAWQDCLISIAGELAEHPRLTVNGLRQVLSGKDREDFRRSWPVVWRGTNPYLKARLFESMHRVVSNLLQENAEEVEQLSHRLERVPQNRRADDPTPAEIESRLAEIRNNWTNSQERERAVCKCSRWTPPECVVTNERQPEGYRE